MSWSSERAMISTLSLKVSRANAQRIRDVLLPGNSSLFDLRALDSF